MKNKPFIILILFCFNFFLPFGASCKSRTLASKGYFGSVSSSSPAASQAAIKILLEGGNAVDAAIAASFMLSVTDFASSGIGGDGFALIRTPEGQIQAWNASIKPPKDRTNNLSDIGMPTIPALLIKLSRIYGKLPLKSLVQPSIETATNGFEISPFLQTVIAQALLKTTNKNTIEFLAPDGYPLRAGQTITNPSLAKTLKTISEDGGYSFYKGADAQTILADTKRLGSSYALSDFYTFRPRVVKPLKVKWKEFTFFGTPPPSSSIVSIMLALKLLEIDQIDLFIKSSEDLIKIAQTGKKLLNAKYLSLPSCINSPELFFDSIKAIEPSTNSTPKYNSDTETTHICVVDQRGMLVSMTLTLGNNFGTGDFSPLGFFYNNQIRNYSIGHYPKDYPTNEGPVTAKSPLIILKNDKPYLAIGGAGADRIIFNVALISARTIKHPTLFEQSIRAPRFFLDHKNNLRIEWGLPASIIDRLSLSPYKVTVKEGCDNYFGLVSAIMFDDTGAAKAIGDQRRSGNSLSR